MRTRPRVLKSSTVIKSCAVCLLWSPLHCLGSGQLFGQGVTNRQHVGATVRQRPLLVQHQPVKEQIGFAFSVAEINLYLHLYSHRNDPIHDASYVNKNPDFEDHSPHL